MSTYIEIVTARCLYIADIYEKLIYIWGLSERYRNQNKYFFIFYRFASISVCLYACAHLTEKLLDRFECGFH